MESRSGISEFQFIELWPFMKKYILVYCLLFFSLNTIAQQFIPSNGASIFVRDILENHEFGEKINVAGAQLFSSVTIQRFYANRGFQLAWSKENKLTERAYEMVYEIKQIQFDGLNPEDYHLKVLEGLFEKYERETKDGSESSEVAMASIDVLLTDAFIMLASHLKLGKVNPESLKATWNIQRHAPEAVYDQRLENALTDENLRSIFESFYPNFSVYKKMRDGVRELYEEKKRFESEPIGEWKAITSDKSIKLGETNQHISEIRKRLMFWKFLELGEISNEDYYDSVLMGAIMVFQKKHGLEPDGVIGQGTIHALNQTPDKLIATSSVNMERLRWLPDSVKQKETIIVNTANFQLDYIVNFDTLLSSRVIVGKNYHATPQFSADMTYLVFSPTWNVPTSITRSEIIPAIRRDPQYLSKKNMVLLDQSGAVVNPSTVDWNGPSLGRYRVRQQPGPTNSLGLVKFMFPNKYNVYIHDTPTRSLFEREDRALSHGCIRLQKPFELAQLLLKHDPSWTEERIREAMRQKNERTVVLNRRIPVILIYLTYWSDSEGNVNFRRDIYNRDAEILQALKVSSVSSSAI